MRFMLRLRTADCLKDFPITGIAEMSEVLDNPTMEELNRLAKCSHRRDQPDAQCEHCREFHTQYGWPFLLEPQMQKINTKSANYKFLEYTGMVSWSVVPESRGKKSNHTCTSCCNIG